MTTFYDLERFGDRTALVTDDLTAISYRKLAAFADRIVRSVPVRSLMFLFADNKPESLAAWLGALRRGVIVVHLGKNLPPESVKTLENAYRPDYFFCPTQRTDLAAPGDETLETFGAWSLVKRCGGGTSGDLAPPFSELAALLSTSGSTGSPKMVRLTAHHFQSNAESIVQALHTNPDDRAITTLPANYSYGLSILHSHWNVGAAVILTDAALTEKRFWTLFSEAKPTHFGGVPYTYEMLRRLRFDSLAAPSLCSISQAGGRMAPERVAEFRDICRQKGIQLYIMYGQTEATARIAVLPPEELDSKPQSIGRPIAGGKITLIGDRGETVTEAGKPGEIVYSGPNVALGYAQNRADLSRGDDFASVLATGDLAVRDSDGCYTIIGRKKRFVKIFGSRVSLDEVERILAENGIESAATGTDDRLTVWITVPQREQFVLEYLSKRTGLARSALEAIYLPQLPRGESGKILYAQLGQKGSL